MSPAPNPNQPDALVEKAARALFDEGVRRCPGQLDEASWDELTDRQPDLAFSFREDARAVLAAVLPKAELLDLAARIAREGVAP